MPKMSGFDAFPDTSSMPEKRSAMSYRVIGIGSPYLAGFIIERLGGYGAIFYYAGILTALSAAVIVITPLGSRREAERSRA